MRTCIIIIIAGVTLTIIGLVTRIQDQEIILARQDEMLPKTAWISLESHNETLKVLSEGFVSIIEKQSEAGSGYVTFNKKRGS